MARQWIDFISRHTIEIAIDGYPMTGGVKSRLERRTVTGYREMAPFATLTPFIDRFWHAAAAENGSFQHYTIVPDGCVDVVYEEVAGRVRSLVFGTSSHTRSFHVTPDANYFGIRFRPGMARHVLNLPPDELTDRHLDLPIFLGLRPEEVVEAASFSAQSGLVEQTLIKTLHRYDITPTPLDQAIDHVQQKQEIWRIETLADMCGLSFRQVERSVKTAIGLSPKLLMRILRVQAAITALQREPQISLVDIAGTLGYSDQAHMNRDFRLLTSSTPAQYRRTLIQKA